MNRPFTTAVKTIQDRWRDDPYCTLNGKPARVSGFALEWATVHSGCFDNSVTFSWFAVDHIMSTDRKFYS